MTAITTKEDLSDLEDQILPFLRDIPRAQVLGDVLTWCFALCCPGCWALCSPGCLALYWPGCSVPLPAAGSAHLALPWITPNYITTPCTRAVPAPMPLNTLPPLQRSKPSMHTRSPHPVPSLLQAMATRVQGLWRKYARAEQLASDWDELMLRVRTLRVCCHVVNVLNQRLAVCAEQLAAFPCSLGGRVRAAERMHPAAAGTAAHCCHLLLCLRASAPAGCARQGGPAAAVLGGNLCVSILLLACAPRLCSGWARPSKPTCSSSTRA